MATTAPAKCFFGSISKHNHGGTPTYVWLCVIVQSPEAGFMATKTPAKCFFGSMSTHNECGRPTYVWMCVLYRVPNRGLWRQKRRPNVTCIGSRTGGYGDNSAGQMFDGIYVHTRPMRQTNVCMDVCILQSPEPRAMATKAPAKCFLYRIVCTGGYGDKSAGQMVPRIYVTTKAADQHRYGCVYQISTPNMV